MNFLTRSIKNKITYSVLAIIVVLTLVSAGISALNSSGVNREVAKVTRETLRSNGLALIEAESRVQAANIAKNIENAAG